MTGERSTRATSPLGILAVVIVATALAPLSMHIIIPSIPGFQDAFGVSYATAQLAIPLFLIGMAGAQLVHGPLSDRFGRRPVMLVGLIVNLLGSALCMVAPTIEILIAGRFVQAVGGCVGMVVGRAIIRDLFDRRRTASLLAYVTMVMVVAPMLAPALGGILDEWQGWQAPLAFLLVAGVIAFAATLRWLPETLAEPGGGLGFASIPGDFAFLLRQRRFIGYAFGLSFTSVTFFAFVGGAPYVTVELLGASPSDYGLFFMPVVASYMLGNFVSARLTQRVGIDRMITMGMIIVVTGGTGALLLHMSGHTTAVTLFGGMAFMALGHGFCIPNQLAGAVSINPRLSGSAAGLSGSLQIGMGALASAVTGALMADSAVPMAVVMFLGALGLLAVHVWGVLTAPAVAAGDGN